MSTFAKTLDPRTLSLLFRSASVPAISPLLVHAAAGCREATLLQLQRNVLHCYAVEGKHLWLGISTDPRYVHASTLNDRRVGTERFQSDG